MNVSKKFISIQNNQKSYCDIRWVKHIVIGLNIGSSCFIEFSCNILFSNYFVYFA